MSSREGRRSLLADLKQWQKVEDETVAMTGEIIENTDNEIVQMVMEIIQRDSLRHHRVQQLLIDSLEGDGFSFTPEQMTELWAMVDRHVQIEQRAVESAKSALAAIDGENLPLQRYLLNYLLDDETKHVAMLEGLDRLKADMYPYG